MAGNKKIYIGSIKVQKISACDCGVLGSKWDIHTHTYTTILQGSEKRRWEITKARSQSLRMSAMKQCFEHME